MRIGGDVRGNRTPPRKGALGRSRRAEDDEIDVIGSREIEERAANEVLLIRGVAIAPPGTTVRNPSFDVTPAELITGIVTEEGVIRAPFGPGLAAAVTDAAARWAPTRPALASPAPAIPQEPVSEPLPTPRPPVERGIPDGGLADPASSLGAAPTPGA